MLSGIVLPRPCPFLPTPPSFGCLATLTAPTLWLPHKWLSSRVSVSIELHEQALSKFPHRLCHYNPWEGATCRTYFHCSMLSLFIATRQKRNQTGVLTSVSHQPPVTFSNRNSLSVSEPEPTAQSRKARLLTGNPLAPWWFTLGIFGLTQTRFLSFSCCKHCFIPGCQEPTASTAAEREWGVNFDRMPDCLLIKNPSISCPFSDPNQN